MRIAFGYTNLAETLMSGCLDATVDEALKIFDGFDGKAARLSVIVDEHLMIAWFMHGPKMYEIQVMDEQSRRKRCGQLLNQLARDFIGRVFDGDRELQDLEARSWFYSSGQWAPETDRDYLFCRALTPEPSPNTTE
jgi:hypothetical protein